MLSVYSLWSAKTKTPEGKTGQTWHGFIPWSSFCLYRICVRGGLEERSHLSDISCNQVYPCSPKICTICHVWAWFMDVIKMLNVYRCKVMIQAADPDDDGTKKPRPKPQKTVLGVLYSIWKSEGILGFFKGLQAQILKTVLSSALLLMIKEKITKTTWVLILAIRRYLLLTRGRLMNA